MTHTGPISNFLEIGIEPYNETSAEYLYKIFGKDMVQGQQFVTLGTSTVTDGVANAPVNVASGEKGENEANRSSILRMLVYTLGATTVLGAAAVGLKRLLPIGKK
ncbi:hypothetical protein E4K67_04600 [Desulfosporosinus fructosivorans]|uniref:Uncharacterized protein n=1 Tax=Desulfosporosinus fructosivorans TaxID=2018669 RepID=A0A4Z0RAY6_9FIRM|nr:hypothetical protein [Desulfosporosinus fructosivorans]TGE38766.1 hypothetical protein E4K67_04600 [Desulfosporosinus fructosivorans]